MNGALLGDGIDARSASSLSMEISRTVGEFTGAAAVWAAVSTLEEISHHRGRRPLGYLDPRTYADAGHAGAGGLLILVAPANCIILQTAWRGIAFAARRPATPCAWIPRRPSIAETSTLATARGGARSIHSRRLQVPDGGYPRGDAGVTPDPVASSCCRFGRRKALLVTDDIECRSPHRSSGSGISREVRRDVGANTPRRRRGESS